MKTISTLIFVMLLSTAEAQSEHEFKVVKRPITEKEYKRYFDLNLTPGVDSICGTLNADFTNIFPYYDSIETFNLKLKFPSNNSKWVFIIQDNPYHNAHGILRFFQKQKDGSNKLIYTRNWKYGCVGK